MLRLLRPLCLLPLLPLLHPLPLPPPLRLLSFSSAPPLLPACTCAAPNVLIWSAVACSSAFPWLFTPGDLFAKDASGAVVKWAGGDDPSASGAPSQRRWCDGSLEEDLPMRGLR